MTGFQEDDALMSDDVQPSPTPSDFIGLLDDFPT